MSDRDDLLDNQNNENKTHMANLVKSNSYLAEVVKTLNALLMGLPPPAKPETGQPEPSRDITPAVNENEINKDTEAIKKSYDDAIKNHKDHIKRLHDELRKKGKKIESELTKIIKEIKKEYTEIRNLGLLDSESIKKIDAEVKKLIVLVNILSSRLSDKTTPEKKIQEATWHVVKGLIALERDLKKQKSSTWWGVRYLVRRVNRNDIETKSILKMAEELNEETSGRLDNFVKETEILQNRLNQFTAIALGMQGNAKDEIKRIKSIYSSINKLVSKLNETLKNQLTREEEIIREIGSIKTLLEELSDFLGVLNNFYNDDSDAFSMLNEINKQLSVCEKILVQFEQSP